MIFERIQQEHDGIKHAHAPAQAQHACQEEDLLLMHCLLTCRGKPAARRERELDEAALTVPCRERDVESSVDAKA
jgi:hypothetical protein